MKKILLIYAPFCTPVSPPYSITYLASFLKDNLSRSFSVKEIDLNIRFHSLKFPEYKNHFKNLKKRYKKEEYEKISKKFLLETGKTYSENNKKVVKNKDPELLNDMLKEILINKPEIVAFSIVYSSQAFYTYALIKELNKLGIKTVVGGPAVNNKLRSIADKHLNNEVELLKYINGKIIEHNKLKTNTILDFSRYKKEDYFTPDLVIPIKTSSSCYYQQCTFCTHHNKKQYFEYDLNNIKKSVKQSNTKSVFIIDDMIYKKRLLEIAKILKPLKISWMCQLKPHKDLDEKTLKTLKESGLKAIIWGIESGNNRVLKLMKKGTNVEDNEKVLKLSKKTGIKNIIYIMFGFPTETKEEFIDTIRFIEHNKENIDLVSTSIFGLQKNTDIYNNPKKYFITKIIETKRTILEPKIKYKVSKGLSQKEAIALRKKHKKTIENINRFPKTMNFFREHMLCLIK